MKINVLPTEIANMIAAGEVVERPGSVVKELVENCIDAGATSITVEIKKGGVPYIRITDNGCGIEADEIETAFKRHATSKIRTATDLDAIGTLGFRGEALASIAAVSRIEIFSKTSSAQTGRCVTVEAGEVLENIEAGCPDGTTMIVRNLFFNTPARMKFLKNDATETGYITDIVNKLVISHPEISFQYINNGKTVLTSSGDGQLLGSIYTVFGKDYARNMTEVHYEEPGFCVTGYVGNSRLARKDRRHQMFFVNARNILSRIMSSAVSEAFKNTVMTGHFPVCVLKMEIDPRYVDVNVHPAKIEVRFSDEKKVYSSVYWAVKNALTDKKFVPEFEIKSTSGNKGAEGTTIKNAPSYEDAKQMEINLLKAHYIETPAPVTSENRELKREATETPAFKKQEKEETLNLKVEQILTKDVETPKECSKTEIKSSEKDTPSEQKADISGGFFASPEEMEKEVSAAEDDVLMRFNHNRQEEVTSLEKRFFQDISNVTYCKPEEEKPKEETPKLTADVDFRLVGQVFGTYILIQKDNELFVIDQHAAHERIYFEELLEEFNTDNISSQLMLLPATMTLSSSELQTALEGKAFFAQLGFEIEDFGQSSLVVRSTPGTMEEQDIRDCVSHIITLLSNHSNNPMREMFEEALHMIACKKALKGNSVLSEKEQKALAEKVLSLGEGINTCPHGRPIMIKMTKYSLEKQFKRIV